MTELDAPPAGFSAWAAHHAFRKLEPGSLALLLMVLGLNGMFTYSLIELSDRRHDEFMAALRACPTEGLLGK